MEKTTVESPAPLAIETAARVADDDEPTETVSVPSPFVTLTVPLATSAPVGAITVVETPAPLLMTTPFTVNDALDPRTTVSVPSPLVMLIAPLAVAGPV